MLCNSFEQLNMKKLNEYSNWVLSFKKFNEIIFPNAHYQKISKKMVDSELISYLLKFGYVND